MVDEIGPANPMMNVFIALIVGFFALLGLTLLVIRRRQFS